MMPSWCTSLFCIAASNGFVSGEEVLNGEIGVT